MRSSFFTNSHCQYLYCSRIRRLKLRSEESFLTKKFKGEGGADLPRQRSVAFLKRKRCIHRGGCIIEVVVPRLKVAHERGCVLLLHLLLGFLNY